MIRLVLAEWVVELEMRPPTLETVLADRYAAFAYAGASMADLRLTVDCEAGGDGRESVLQASLREKGEDYLLDGPQFYGMIGPFQGQAALRMRSDAPARETEYFLRVALSLFAWARGGVLVHCAAIKVGDETFLFTGQSGSGKSTVVALSRERGWSTALSDDLVLLRFANGAWRAYGTPFWNLEAQTLPAAAREGQTASGSVRAIYKLVQDRDVFVEPMSPASAAAELLANCPIVNSLPGLLPDLLARCRDIAGAVGMQKLHFRKDDAFWDIISC
jgi:hypothetical protein